LTEAKRKSPVTIELAAELAHVDVHTIRRWTVDGLLKVERRGDIETVSLADVHALASVRTSRSRAARRGALRDLLREAPKAESLGVADLQRLVRERAK
jgi:DNA-binding transcriptional MerR regulator